KEAEPYADALQLAGMEPVLREPKPGIELEGCRGLLLTGGGDVSPSLYGETARPETQPPDPERDAVEGDLIDAAMATVLPLLANCRGMQIVDVHLGGSLVQHLPTADRHVRRTTDRSLPAHQVTIEPGTKLSAIAQRPSWSVNSRHHQAVGRLADGLQ